VALSDFHIALSAAALTDGLLGLWLVLAVDAIARSLAAGDFRFAVGAGIYTGVAWWTKYNGWLPLAIEGTALPLLWLVLRPPAGQWIKWFGCFAVTCVVACAVWSPYFFSLQSQGGYGPIAANHAKYVVGLAGWMDSTAQQLSNQAVMEGPLSRLGVLVALALPAILSPGVVRRDWMLAAAILGIGMAALYLPTVLVVACSAGVGLGGSVLAITPMRDPNSAKMRWAIGLALVMAWWMGMLVATPCYSPYPRLMLPWLLAGWLGAAICWSGVWQAGELKLLHTQHRAQMAGLLVLLVAAVVTWVLLSGSWNHIAGPADRRGIEDIAKQVHAMSTQDDMRVIYTYGEPALYFQLRAAREDIVAPVQEVPRQAATVEGKAVPTILIVGPHSQSDARFQEQWEEGQTRFELIKTFEYVPSAMVWLDLYDPRKGAPEPGVHAVRLYRLKP
jgi:dolichyl-phosphate-mannose-protein mannosyltransferase